jgi:hypothetical protein
MNFQDNYLIALTRHDLLSVWIYHLYTINIPFTYQTYTMQRSQTSLLSCPSELGHAATCIYDAPISTTGKKDVDPGASLSLADLWAARAPPAAAWPPPPLPPPPLTDWRNNARPHGACPYMRQHANAIAKATVNRVFAAVPGLNNKPARALLWQAAVRKHLEAPPPPRPGPARDGAGGGAAHHGAGVSAGA